MTIFNSINTNVGALVALRNLNNTNSDLAVTQNRVSTGLKVSSAKEDASVFAVAQGVRADLKSFEAVGQALAAGKGVQSVAITGATSVSDLLKDVKAKLVQLSDDSLTADQRAIYTADFTSQKQQILSFIQGATYNGVNILTTGAVDVNVVSTVDGQSITLRAQDLEAAYTTFDGVAVASTDGADARAALAAGAGFDTFETAVNDALGNLGADNRSLDFQIKFNKDLSDATEEGLGSLVDADLAKESARLQALQTKQQLAVQTLSIANQAPGILLSLFR